MLVHVVSVEGGMALDCACDNNDAFILCLPHEVRP